MLLNSSMKPVLKEETVLRVQETVDAPISRGMDNAINKCLDELDALKAEKAKSGKQDSLCWMESNCSEQDEEVET